MFLVHRLRVEPLLFDLANVDLQVLLASGLCADVGDFLALIISLGLDEVLKLELGVRVVLRRLQECEDLLPVRVLEVRVAEVLD